MVEFSEGYNIGKTQPELDFVNIDTTKDLPLFIDPFALSIRQDSWSLKCNDLIVSFFQAAVDFISEGSQQKAQLILNGLSEPNETCFGLSKGVPDGRGVGGKQAIDLYKSLAESQAAQTGLLSELADCDLFIPSIGRDKISDITTNIIRQELIEYRPPLKTYCILGEFVIHWLQ